MSGEGNGLRFITNAYRACEKHPLHEDAQSRISFLLQGSCAEDNPIGSFTFSPGDILVKGSNISHENRFGADGAFIASVLLDNDAIIDSEISNKWILKRDHCSLREGLLMLDAALAGCRMGLMTSVVSILAYGNESRLETRGAPKWIVRLKNDLETAGLKHINVSKRALEAGAHPVCASRMFRDLFGVSITEHAQYHSIRRALALLSNKAISLKELALMAGFYDQSHMNRIFQRVLGRTPGALRGILVKNAPMPI